MRLTFTVDLEKLFAVLGGYITIADTSAPEAVAADEAPAPKPEKKKDKPAKKETAVDAEAPAEAPEKPKKEDKPAKKEKASDGAPTLEDVRTAMLAAAELVGPPKAIAVMQEIAGVKKVSAAPEEKFAELIAAFVQLKDLHEASE